MSFTDYFLIYVFQLLKMVNLVTTVINGHVVGTEWTH